MIIVGINHTNNYHPGNNDNTTDHFVVINKRNYDYEKNQYYYNYIETGHFATNPTKAVANDNRLYYDPQAGTFKDNTGGTKRQQNTHSHT